MDVGLVCDACSTFNAMGASDCCECGTSLSLGPSDHAATADERSKAKSSKSKKAASMKMCPNCGERVPDQNRFCGSCGQMISEITEPAMVMPQPTPGSARKTMFFGAMQQARAKLVLIKGDGLDGVSFTLAGEEHIAGRIDAPLLFE